MMEATLQTIVEELRAVRRLLEGQILPKPFTSAEVRAYEATDRLNKLIQSENVRLKRDGEYVIRCHHSFRDDIIKWLVMEKRFINVVTLDDGRKGVQFSGATLIVDWELNDTAADKLYIERIPKETA